MRPCLAVLAVAVLCGVLGSATAAARPSGRGRLIVVGPDRPVFTEGFVLRATLTRAGRSVPVPTHRQPARLVDARLPPGAVTLRLRVLPCDANCGHLDAPLRCSARLRLVAGETTRVRLTFGRSPRCRVLVTARR